MRNRSQRAALPSSSPLPVPELIRTKRDGGRLAPEAIRGLVRAYTAGEVPDYQMAAFLMAAWLRGLDGVETAALLDAMLHSGVVLDLTDIPGPKVDKHSTGGVGDKVSIGLAPLVASAGVVVPMISGRGLGHTGGTLDKLESIPGFDVRLSLPRFRRILGRLGTCLIGQTAEIAPADRKLYALRDVTATVESIPLITASILSKKLAEGLDGLVLDVKTGEGAFLPDLEGSRALARALVAAARRAGCRTTALITDMSQPLGHTVGNALELKEAIAFLRNEGPADLRELTLALGAEMLVLGRAAPNRDAARRDLERRLGSGEAFERFLRVVEAQGGDPASIEHPERLPRSAEVLRIRASRSGVIRRIHARTLGEASVALGAGRSRIDDPIDPGAGLVLCRKVGERVDAGDVLAEAHARTAARLRAAAPRIRTAFVIGNARPESIPLILDRLG